MAVTKAEMKESSQSASTVWMKFTRNYPKNEDALHSFFEGEDRKYYIDRIENHCNLTIDKIITYNCKGKKGVKDICKKLNNNPKYDVNKLAFFMDKDFNLDNDLSFENIYLTNLHSLEKFYTSKTAFERLIRTELNINSIDDDYKKILNDYVERLNEFRNHFAYLNAFYMAFYKVSGELIYEKFNYDELIDIKVTKIHLKQSLDFENLNIYYFNKLELDEQRGKKNASERLSEYLVYLEKAREEFEDILEDVQMNLEEKIHGKMELFFLRRILFDMKNLIKSKSYFKEDVEQLNCEQDSRNILSNFSRYADTPNCLIDFLKRYSNIAIRDEELMC